jgi:glycoprotein endo-alpha-1,2-mannosidase
MKKLIVSLLLLAAAGSAWAVDRDWTNANGNRLWRTAANWSGGVVPTGADKAAIRNSSISGPIIDSSTSAVANQIVIGDWGSTSDSLTITGGTLTTSGTSPWVILGYGTTNNGSMIISGGVVNVGSTLYAGFSGRGTIDMSGGTVNVAGTLGIAQQTGSTGDLFLDGGTISCGSLNMTSGGAIDITAGTLIVDGDATSTINGYISSGWITGYGGAGTVNVSYNTPNAGKTTVTATQASPPSKAVSPSPANSASDVGITTDLSWTAGDGATSHDVYFGTDSTPDSGEFQGNQAGTTFDTGTMAYSTTYYWRIDEINGNGTTTGDVWSFTTEAAPQPPGQASNPSPSDSATNVGLTTDLGWTAGDGATSHDVYFGTDSTPDAGEFQGNQAGTSFDTGTMANNTTYYWRIDEKNANGTTTGDVWSFTTTSGGGGELPAQATDPTPPDSTQGVGIMTDVSWTAGAGAASHDVYFGTSNPPVFQVNQAATTFDTGTMTYSTTYYWRIDEVNDTGTTTGNLWSFTTAATPPPPSLMDWTNGGGDRLWKTAANWNGGVVPGPSDKAAIRNDLILGPIINSSTTAEANQVVVGDWNSYIDTVDITGGSLAVYDWFILAYDVNNHGTLTISGGTVDVGTDMFAGFGGTGTINMTGGTITVNGMLGIAQNTGSIGTVYLDGGTINAGMLNMTSGGLLDITAGTLILAGDATLTVGTYVGNGWITAYGGSGVVNVEYNGANPLKTTVTALQPTNPPTKATNPNPPDSATGVSIFPTLSWTLGTGASSHDVYFGTSNPPAFKGNQTAVTYNPGVLNNNTNYYWRIDEKNVIGTTTGDVWSFTTINDSSYTLLGKVMCGYQGWFNCPSDGTNRGWRHWSTSTSSFTPINVKVDFWPDMTEYTTGEKFAATSFNDANGTHYVFSSHNLQTVRRHFQWMQDYGIDGVYLQRFATEITPGTSEFNHRNDVLAYCKDAASLYGRKYAIMYDLSGLPSGGTQKVIDDWKYLVDNSKVTFNPNYDPGYIFHENKPVVGVWGVGFSGRAYTHAEVRNLVNFLKTDATYGGTTVLIGVPMAWRDSTNSDITATYALADIISPWLVDYYHTTGEINNWASRGHNDQVWCNGYNPPKDYLPVISPGFSTHNMYPTSPLNHIPRNGGQFLWDQVFADISVVGANMFFIAMFDEVDEGTAIFKVTNNPPEPGGTHRFVTPSFDGIPLPSDEYLWLTGQAGRALRGEITAGQTRPARTASAETNWTNGNGNRAWNTAANWDSGVPVASDKAGIRNSAVSGPIIAAGTNAVANQIVVGDLASTNDTLDMTGGTLTTSGTNCWMILGYNSANHGTFSISAGTVNIGDNLFVGNSGTGTLTQTGGTITVTGTLGVAQVSGGTGTANLDGGSISCGSFNMTSGGHVDITAGTLIINGDVTAAINAFVTGGQIAAYGGSGTVNVSYNTPNAGKTTVTATSASPPTKATSPSPSTGAGDVVITADLSWTAGTGATSHDVYFGTDSTPDSTEFQGNQGSTTFDPGTLANSTTYYWRIDEKNTAGTTTGDVWSFTTAAATGGDKNWTNGGGTRAWATAANWDTGVPTSLDKAAIRNSAISGPIIASGTTAEANQIVVGDWSSTQDTLDMTGGSLTTGSWVVFGYGASNNGIFTISGGTANLGDNLYIGLSGAGTLTQTGGTINVTGTFGVAQLAGSTATANLNGGSISCGSFNMTSGGHVDITTGTLIINGDVTSAINGFVSGGQITAYGGNGTVNVSYDTPNAGKTTVTATPAPTTPTFVAAGSVKNGTGSVNTSLPSGIQTGDILLLFVETANQTSSISNQNGGTWTQITNSPQGTGTAGSTSATRLTAFWSRYNGSQGAPTVADSGNHQLTRIIAIRGAAVSGNPWDVTAGGVESTSDTSGSIPGATTTVGNCLVVTAIATSVPDASGTSNFSSWANSNLASLTERTDNTVNSGNGGGLAIATGVKAAAGAYGNTTVTCGSSATKGMMSIAVKP